MRRPILTLTTDFGASDHYVGAMKGVILSICPQAQIVDICHDVTPFQIAEGAYVIAQAYDCFPKKTVHVVVVDPGVGTERRPILVEAAGQYFVGPDNGVLSMVYSRGKHKVRLIANDRYFRHPVSATFHGRDIFAPVAAHVAAGIQPSRIGKPIEDYLRPEFAQPRRSGERTWIGAILKIDRFGNVVTNFHVRDFPDLLAGESACPTIARQSGTDAFVCQPASRALHPPSPALHPPSPALEPASRALEPASRALEPASPGRHPQSRALHTQSPALHTQSRAREQADDSFARGQRPLPYGRGSVAPVAVVVTVGRRRIAALAQNYAESRAGALFLIVGSSGYLEVSVNQGSAAKQIGCKTGEPVQLTVG
jgi:S-adenosyl-L-methionine hydrolase (adenosine-forming)